MREKLVDRRESEQFAQSVYPSLSSRTSVSAFELQPFQCIAMVAPADQSFYSRLANEAQQEEL